MTAEAALAQFQTLGAWFGFTLLALLILVSVATMLVRYRNYRKQSCAIYFLTGVVTLIGSQMIAFPIAFCFFLAAGFCFLHRDDRHNKKTTDTVSKQGGVA
jgi:ABC-type transport system involved in multi-copper enzyme maturation permease subunit